MPDKASKKRIDRDSVRNTLTVAIGLSLVCSILVASTAVLLKPRQERNEEQFRQRIILEVASLMEPGGDIETLFASIEPRLVDLASGDYVDSIDAGTFDALAMANDPELGVAVPTELDTGNIQRRAKYAPVYLVSADDKVEQIILPVYGSGLWGKMYGYLALQPDGTTVTGLRFYEHIETPGLGDQVDAPRWREQWVGKKIHGADGTPRIEVIRGAVATNGDPMETRYQVDGLSGATLTGRGVTNLVRYWTGPHGFGPYLEKLARSEDST
ncbi:MAG: Na(+)-translocating NADH-quinone reductase subunit C [Burkholderiaceae bacterium]|nr:Na(+)-translocating NADH-quinone reductase subunit C [Burkholderiaceae bacterium]